MIYLYLLNCIGAIILQGFFAASEISFISCSPLKLRHRHQKGDQRAKKVYELLLKPEKFLATTLMGTNMSVVLSSSIFTFLLIELGVKKSNLGITFAFSLFIVIFAELIPKNIGRFFREDFSCKTVSVISSFEKLFLPVIKVIETLSRLLVKIFVKKVKAKSPFVTKEEIKLLVKEIERQGGIDQGEKEAIEEIFEFRNDKVKNVGKEIKKVITFNYADTYATIVEKVKQYGFIRYPVLQNSQIAGYINIYDLFYNPQDNWQSFIRPIIKVEFNQKLHEVFTVLQAKKESIALVAEDSKTWGIITVQDLIREIVTSLVKA